MKAYANLAKELIECSGKWDYDIRAPFVDVAPNFWWALSQSPLMWGCLLWYGCDSHDIIAWVIGTVIFGYIWHIELFGISTEAALCFHGCCKCLFTSIPFTAYETPRICSIISVCSLSYCCKVRTIFCNSTFTVMPDPPISSMFGSSRVVVYAVLELEGSINNVCSWRWARCHDSYSFCQHFQGFTNLRVQLLVLWHKIIHFFLQFADVRVGTGRSARRFILAVRRCGSHRVIIWNSHFSCFFSRLSGDFALCWSLIRDIVFFLTINKERVRLCKV